MKAGLSGELYTLQLSLFLDYVYIKRPLQHLSPQAIMAPRKRRLEFDTYGSHEASSRDVQSPTQLERHTHYEPSQAGEDSFYEIPTFSTTDTALLPEEDNTELPMLEDKDTYCCGGDDDDVDFYGVDPSELEAVGLLSIADQISLGETGGDSHKPRRTRTQAVGSS